jgi:hypothetical protein
VYYVIAFGSEVHSAKPFKDKASSEKHVEYLLSPKGGYGVEHIFVFRGELLDIETGLKVTLTKRKEL